MKTSSAFNYMKNSFSLHSWMTALSGSVFLASGFSFFLSEIWIYHIILFWSGLQISAEKSAQSLMVSLYLSYFSLAVFNILFLSLTFEILIIS